MCVPSPLRTVAFDESGGSMIEYGMVTALISIVAIILIQAIGGRVGGLFDGVINTIR